MKICILDDDDPGDQQFPYAPEYYLTGHEWEKHLLKKATAVTQIQDLSEKNFDVFLNLCDGAWDEPRPGIEVVQALERLDQAFTGADQYFYEPTREAMKMVCEANELGFPKGVHVTRLSGLDEVVEHLKFPLLVKHPNSYASVGLTPKSKVNNVDELREQAAIMIKRFGATLIEEFIEGSEYSVLVAENPDNYDDPVVFTPIQVIFANGETFKHEALKWIEYDKLSAKAVTDEKLKHKLENIGKKIFTGLHGTGYCRCDVRSDKEGNLYLLDVNPNGAVLYPPNDPGTADHILHVDPRGHKTFVDLILRSAVKEKEKRQKGFEVKYSPASGFGIYAAHDYKVGQEILAFEDLPHGLYNKSEIDAKTNGDKERLVASSFHLSPEIFYGPAWNTEQWHPVVHSCDPNAWFQKGTLHLIARHYIRKGDPITVDYATIFTEEMPTFTCDCDSKNCRHTVTGEDYKNPVLADYAGHRTPYIEGLLAG